MKSVDFRNDPMFLRNQFARDGTFEMPVIKKTKLDLDDIEFIGYDKLNDGQTDKIVHFFLDDYKFEDDSYAPKAFEQEGVVLK